MRHDTTTKREALASVMGQLEKILPMLASDKVGEVANAASRIVHVLAKVKLDLHDLVLLLKEEPVRHQSNSSPFETDQEALVRFGSTAKYFLNSAREVFADIMVSGHRETWPLASAQYSEWLTQRFWVDKDRIPAPVQLKSVIQLLRARALFSTSQRHDVHLRVAEFEAKIYLDLADESWRAVEIDAEGWRVIDAPPVRFRRTAAMQPLPNPVRGGTIDELRQFVNLNESDFLLSVAFALDTLRVGRPHPVLYLAGGEGTAKSTLTQILGSLIDPHRLKLRRLPNVRDLFVAAHNQSILCFDNVSGIAADTSDALCQITSGAGFAKRKNYTDGEEFQVAGAHPVILNGIENCIDRPDLADRAIVLNLPRVDPARRRPEAEFWAAFENARPRLLGALLDIAVHGLANAAQVGTSELARVADFQRWALACETAFSAPGAFMRAFANNTTATVEGLIDGDPVAKAITAFMLDRRNWHGTAAELLSELTRHDQTEARVSRLPTWPRDPARLSKALRAMQPTLTKAGITIEFDKAVDRRRTRTVKIWNRATNDGPCDRPGSHDDGQRITEANAPRPEARTA